MAPGTYHDGQGLMLIVREADANNPGTGPRSWILRLQVNGKRRDYGLGSGFDVSLAEAREKAAELRRLVKSGRDPIGEKRAAKRAELTIPTFKAAAEQAHGEQQASWRNEKHRQDWLSSLRLYAFDKIGEARVDKLTPQDLKAVLMPVWLEKPETARRLRQRLRAVMAWAAAEGHCQPLDMSLIDASLPKQPRRDGHFAAMPWSDVPAFFGQLRGGETVGRRALAFTILTAARSGETRGATWREIDFEAGEWRIPGERMKAGREHVVPLSAPALAILRSIKGDGTPEPDAIIFAGRKGEAVSDMTLTKVMRDMGIVASIKVSGTTVKTAKTVKQKDGPEGETVHFSLETVTLGTNSRGKPVTTCLVNIVEGGSEERGATGSAIDRAKVSLVGHKKTALRILEELQARSTLSVPAAIPALAIDRAKVCSVIDAGHAADTLANELRAFVKADPDKIADTAERTARRVMSSLKSKEILGSWGEFLWIN